MNVLRIVNHDHADRMLVIKRDFSSFHETQRPSTLERSHMDLGFYVRIHDDIVAMVATEAGPVLLIDNKLIALNPDQIHIAIEEKEAQRTCTITQGEERLLRVTYDKPPTNYDVWSTDEMMDFFLWLANGYRQTEFQSFFTVRAKEADN